MCRGTNEEKKLFLEKIGCYIDIIASLERTLHAEEAKKVGVKAVDYSKEQVKGGIGNGWDYLIDVTDQYKEEIIKTTIEMVEHKRVILECVKKVEDLRLSRLLVLRYVERLEWHQIEDILNIATPTRNKLHALALTELVLLDTV